MHLQIFSNTAYVAWNQAKLKAQDDVLTICCNAHRKIECLRASQTPVTYASYRFSANKRNDFKTLLQQLAEQDGAAILEYKLVCEEGPEHDKSFTVAAYINNNEVGRGVAKTKKNAEMEAARVALKLFGVTV